MNEGSAESVLLSVLLSLGYPAKRLFYEGEDDTFFTYAIRGTSEVGHADDHPAGDAFTFAVDLFSKHNYTKLLRELRAALRAAGFFGFAISAEVYEVDTGYYHVSAEIKYLEV